MTEYRTWTVRSTLNVPSGNESGDVTVAAYEAATRFLPTDATGLTASADTSVGTVTVTFTLADATRDFAQSVAEQMCEYLAGEVPAALGAEVPELVDC